MRNDHNGKQEGCVILGRLIINVGRSLPKRSCFAFAKIEREEGGKVELGAMPRHGSIIFAYFIALAATLGVGVCASVAGPKARWRWHVGSP